MPSTESHYQNDPGQLDNLLKATSELGPARHIAGHAIDKVVSRLDALLLVLKSCEGRVCREPWKSLHPDGSITTLKDALAARYDRFYLKEQTKVQYDHCENGYFPEAEGPSWKNDGKAFERYGLDWSVWT